MLWGHIRKHDNPHLRQLRIGPSAFSNLGLLNGHNSYVNQRSVPSLKPGERLAGEQRLKQTPGHCGSHARYVLFLSHMHNWRLKQGPEEGNFYPSLEAQTTFLRGIGNRSVVRASAGEEKREAAA